MNDISRRTVLGMSVGAGLAGVNVATADEPPFDDKGEKARIMEAGLSADEADCWIQVANAAGSFFKLPKLHPMDAQEVATAIHIIQHKLLARPTYRKYLELAKAQSKKKD